MAQDELTTLTEQYKLYVEMADKISERRADTNKFYTTILTGLLAVLSLVFEKEAFSDIQNVVLLAIAVLGILLCVVWWINIRSYGQLNSGKFKVVHEIEQKLPFASYDREWELLGKGQDWKKYLPLTLIEPIVPILLAIPYLLLLFYALSQQS